MGQQQLLLIVLGVIIVGIAVVVGINVFTASSFQANRDAVVSDLTNIAANAQQFYRKPVALGGGGNSFTGYTIPTQLQSTPNNTGNYTATVTNGGEGLELVGVTAEKEGDATVTVKMTVSKDAIVSTVFSATT